MSLMSDMTTARLTEDLAYRFESVFTADEVAETVERIRAELEPTSRHPEFLPVLIERATRDDLNARARARGRRDTPELLFVCQHNEGRSQMAAALAEHLSEGRVHVRSAGATPTGLLNAAVIEVLAERGIDLETAYPTPIRDDVLAAADVTVTMGSDLPAMPGRHQVTWEIADPHHRSVDEVRAIREDIEQHVIELLTDLGIEISPDAVRPVAA
ncbi:MAG: arsenate reductase ArsC [Mobilicoccus sp.]|nr:arsenate reductase ArsC [Mobilicoccus sp.]